MTFFKVLYWIAAHDHLYSMGIEARDLDSAEAKVKERLKAKMYRGKWVYQIYPGNSLRDGEFDSTKK